MFSNKYNFRSIQHGTQIYFDTRNKRKLKRVEYREYPF